MELFRNTIQINVVHVPYKGSAAASAEIAAPHIHMMFTSLSTVQSFLASGRLRALAIARLKRLPAAPDVPTIGESGIRGLEASTWCGVHAPARTPKAIIVSGHRKSDFFDRTAVSSMMRDQTATIVNVINRRTVSLRRAAT
jgi:tripartite-type tricarboxylate transporter receptor subunit TctC